MVCEASGLAKKIHEWNLVLYVNGFHKPLHNWKAKFKNEMEIRLARFLLSVYELTDFFSKRNLSFTDGNLQTLHHYIAVEKHEVPRN